MRLTDMTLQKLATPERGQQEFRDDTLPGFGVRVSKSAKTFVLVTGKAGNRQRITLGRYPLLSLADARRKAQTILRDQALGIVPKNVPTLAALKSEYLARRDGEVRAATRQGDKYLFKHFDGLMSRKLDDISPEAIEALIDAIDAPSTKRSAYIRISGLFSYAVRRGYLDRSPARALSIPADQAPRHRVLSDDELAKVLTVARMGRLAGDQYSTITELLIYTLQRRNQIAALNRSMVDFEARTITWPGEFMKRGKRHVIPLSDHVCALLRAIEPQDCLRSRLTETDAEHHKKIR